MILVRHGQSDFNIGHSTDFNSDLTSFGIKQAKRAGKILSSYLGNKYSPDDVIITSPFNHCLQTASIISGFCGMNIEIEYCLIEYICEKHGFTEENKPWKVNRDYTIPSLDNDKAIIDRVNSIYRRYNNTNVIVISHGGPINILTMLAEGKTVDKYPEWDSSILNCSITDTNNLSSMYKI